MISALSHTSQGFLCFCGIKTRKFPNARGSQRQVSVDISSVEGGSPWAVDVDERVHWDFRRGNLA